jgi:hypothetical protein
MTTPTQPEQPTGQHLNIGVHTPCASIRILRAGTRTQEAICKTPATWRLTVRGLVIVTMNLCDEHFDKARRALEGDKREWSATPLSKPGTQKGAPNLCNN